MKKSEELGRKTRKMIAKNLIILAVLAVATVVGVRSWFTTNASADAAGIHVECAIPDGLEVQIVAPGGSVQNDKWVSGNISLDATNYPFLSTLNMLPITGDGRSFIQPPLTQLSSVATVNTNVTWSQNAIKTTANVEYLSFDIYFRVKTANQKVILSNSSYYGPLDSSETFGSAVTGYSSNSVIGACRMSVVDSSNQRELLWVPAPHLYYNGMDLSIDNTDTANTFGLNYVDAFNVTRPIHSDGTYNHGYYSSDKSRTLVSQGSDVRTNVTANTNKDYLLHKDVDIANLTTASDNYYINHVRFNFWIEGEDPESRATQVGGEFKAILSFNLGAAS